MAANDHLSTQFAAYTRDREALRRHMLKPCPGGSCTHPVHDQAEESWSEHNGSSDDGSD